MAFNLLALLSLLSLVCATSQENFVSLGFLAENNSKQVSPLPCVIFLFKLDVVSSAWSLHSRYEYFEKTNAMTHLSPSVAYQLAISCKNNILATPERITFVASGQKYENLVVGKFTLLDKISEIPEVCEVNATREVKDPNLEIPLSKKGINVTQKGNNAAQPGKSVSQKVKDAKKADKKINDFAREGNTQQQNEEAQLKEKNTQNETQQGGEKKVIEEEEGWVVPRTWEHAVKLYGKYALLVAMIVQVIWALLIKDQGNARRRLQEKSQALPPNTVVNQLTKQ